MQVSATREVVIVGAGLAGTLLALLLARRGFRVEVFERNPDPRGGHAAAGRSINLALAERGRHALRLAGMLEAVDRFTLPMRGRMLHDLDGHLTLQPYGADASEVIYSTHRALLNRTLLDAAEQTGQVQVHFDHRLEHVDWHERHLAFRDPQGSRQIHPFEVLIGADGAGSAVREAMSAIEDLGVSEELLDHGYRELTITPAADGGFRTDPHALHIWPRGGFMLIALPNMDGSFTATLFLPNDGKPGFAQLATWPAQQDFMHHQFPDAVPLLTRLQADFRDNPVGLLGTIRCRRWHADGRALLIGDAAHAVVPFHGQGMNAAFEDVVELAHCLENTGQDWQSVFASVEERRIANANAIADMALENYVIMRDAVRDPRFLLRKALEHELERRHPQRFVARYSLVMFHRIPYTEAYARGATQAAILDRLLREADDLAAVDYALAERLISERLDILQEPA